MQKPVSQSSYINEPFTANEIRFFVYTEEPKKGWYDRVELKFKLAIIAINIILAMIAGGLWIHIFTSNSRRKTHMSAWIFTILTIVLALFGFLN